MTMSETFALMLLSCFFGMGIYAFVAAWFHNHPQDSIRMQRHRRRRRSHIRFWGL